MKKTRDRRQLLLAFAGLRAVLGVVAIFAAKFLYEDNFLLLVLMRPTKEVFLAGAFLARRNHEPSLLLKILLAGLPMSMASVWISYYLGRFYSKEIRKGKLPGLAGRLIPVDKVRALQKVLKKRGEKVVFLGRLAAFPSSVIGIAAGSSDVPSRKFLIPDALGALAAIVEVMSLGFLLGGFFDKDNPVVSWSVTGAAVAVTFGLLFFVGRSLRKE